MRLFSIAVLALCTSFTGCVVPPGQYGYYQSHTPRHVVQAPHCSPSGCMPTFKTKRYSEQMHPIIDENGRAYLMPHSAFVPFVNPE